MTVGHSIGSRTGRNFEPQTVGPGGHQIDLWWKHVYMSDAKRRQSLKSTVEILADRPGDPVYPHAGSMGYKPPFVDQTACRRRSAVLAGSVGSATNVVTHFPAVCRDLGSGGAAGSLVTTISCFTSSPASLANDSRRGCDVHNASAPCRPMLHQKSTTLSAGPRRASRSANCATTSVPKSVRGAGDSMNTSAITPRLSPIHAAEKGAGSKSAARLRAMAMASAGEVMRSSFKRALCSTIDPPWLFDARVARAGMGLGGSRRTLARRVRLGSTVVGPPFVMVPTGCDRNAGTAQRSSTSGPSPGGGGKPERYSCGELTVTTAAYGLGDRCGNKGRI